MRIAYADPPYPGCAHYYEGGSEVDHAELIARMERDYDGWLLHTHVPGLRVVLPLLPADVRVMAWVKPFAAFKRNIPVAYAWEPVLVKAARKPVVTKRVVMRDWFSCSITLKRGMCGAKPEALCRWAFEMLGADPADELDDLYPGTGAVTKAWAAWRESLGGGALMLWRIAFRADPEAREIADRHYNRQKVGAPQFVPPGRCLVLKMPGAFWVTSWPFGEYVKHAWPGAWMCSAFRNESSGHLSSALIREAVAATRYRFGEPPAVGMVTFVDAGKVRRKRDPGRCFRKAGFVNADPPETEGGLVALQLWPDAMPEADAPLDVTLGLFSEAS